MTTLADVKQRLAAQRGALLTREQRTTRAEEIDRLYEEEGQTLNEIAHHFGITRERVRQIRTARGRTGVMRKRGRLLAVAASIFWLAMRERATLTMLDAKLRACEDTGLPQSALDELVACLPAHQKAVIKRLLRWRHRHELLDRLRLMGADLGRTPTKTDIENEGARFGVHVVRLQDHFGSLREAQRRAGFVPNPAGRPPVVR